MFRGFTDDALDFYQFIHDSGFSTDSYNSRKSVFHEDIKPQLNLLLEQAADAIVDLSPGIQHPDSDRVGNPFTRGGARGFGWGALSRPKKNRRSDLQLFVALRPQTIRVGLYASREYGKAVFSRLMKHIYRNPEEFCKLLDGLEPEGIILCEPAGNKDLGQMVPLQFVRAAPNVAIGEQNEIDLLKSFPIADGGNPEFVLEVINVFRLLIPIREFLLE